MSDMHSRDVSDVHRLCRSAHKQYGLTLIELVVTIALLAILTTLGIPSFNDSIKRNRLISEVNRFVSHVQLARSEAIKRNQTVRICKQTNGTCNSNAQWDAGWVVFIDINGDDQVQAIEEIRRFDGIASNYTLRSGVALEWVDFQSNGRPLSGSGGYPATGLDFGLCAADAEDENDQHHSRTLTLNSTGRIDLQEGTSVCP